MKCNNCLQEVSDPYDHVNTYGPSYICKQVKATGGNPPKEKKPETKKPPKVRKKPSYSYMYDPKTGLFSMTAASLTEWLMDVQGRAKLEKVLSKSKFTEIPFDIEGIVV